MIPVIRKHTGELLGHCDNFIVCGKRITIPYMTKHCLTEMSFRFQLIHNKYWNKPPIRIIAHGYRDASLLPGFKRFKTLMEIDQTLQKTFNGLKVSNVLLNVKKIIQELNYAKTTKNKNTIRK